MKSYDLVIVGGGSAGMAAAIEAYKLGIKDILIIEKDNYLGGILNQCIHNGFGLIEFKEELTGPEYLERFVDQVHEYGIKYKLNTFLLDISKDKILTISSKEDGVMKIEAKAVIFATGCYERTAGQILIQGDRPSGVITAGTAQKYLNIHGYLVGKRVLILGSGDIGLIMARRMTLEGAKVLGVCEINPFSSGLARNIRQCLDDFDIPLYLSHTVKEVRGKSRLEQVVISQVDEDYNIIENTEKVFDCDTLLLSVGLIPYVTLLKKARVQFVKNKVFVYDNLETSIPGIFIAGNALHVHDIVDFVTKEARIAAKGAYDYLKKIKHQEQIEVIHDENVSYVVPNIVRRDDNNLNIKFRVKKPISNAVITIINNDKPIIMQKTFGLNPSELVDITINKSRITSWGHPIEVKVKI